jgi:restriction endonuclease S subunit
VQKIVAAAPPTEEQDAMAAKISKLKNELDELDQLLYGKKKRRGAK